MLNSLIKSAELNKSVSCGLYSVLSFFEITPDNPLTNIQTGVIMVRTLKGDILYAE